MRLSLLHEGVGLIGHEPDPKLIPLLNSLFEQLTTIGEPMIHVQPGGTHARIFMNRTGTGRDRRSIELSVKEKLDRDGSELGTIYALHKEGIGSVGAFDNAYQAVGAVIDHFTAPRENLSNT
jgi:hypothetical protein